MKLSGFCQLVATGHSSNIDAVEINKCYYSPPPPPEPAVKRGASRPVLHPPTLRWTQIPGRGVDKNPALSTCEAAVLSDSGIQKSDGNLSLGQINDHGHGEEGHSQGGLGV